MPASGTNTHEASPDPLRDSGAFKFGQGGQNVELQFSRGRRAIDALAQTHERDAHRLKLLEQRDEMFQVAAEAIESPAHDDVKLPAARIDDEAIERRPAVLRPAHAAVNVLGQRP